MSWSISYIGKPEAISEKLQKHSEALEGKSKEEFDAALPHLDALVKMNHNTNWPGLTIRLVANGHAWNDTVNSHSNCNVAISTLNEELV